MDGFAGLIVGCVIFVPAIVVLLMASWKLWHGKWLSFSDFSYVPGEGSESLHRRKGRRTALACLAGVAACSGVLGVAAFSAMSGFPSNLELASSVMVFLVLVGGIWLSALSRRDAKSIANTAVDSGAELVEEYSLDKHRVTVLVVVILTILILEIASSFVPRL